MMIVMMHMFMEMMVLVSFDQLFMGGIRRDNTVPDEMLGSVGL